MHHSLSSNSIAESNNDTAKCVENCTPNFEEFYDKYAAAFYGEIKKSLGNEVLSQKVLIDSCVKIHESFSTSQVKKDNPFIAAFKVVKKEISNTKVNTVLDQILYSQNAKAARV